MTTDKGLWYEDGNLILQAEDTLYRVYGGLLASRSSVFRDMLSFPSPEEGNPTMHGCPVVPVYDSPRHLTHFLRAIFDSSFFEPPPAPTELHIVESILLLSHKYDVQFLKRRALSHLNSTFPTTLPGWKSREQTRTIPPIDNTPFAALRIARDLDLDWLLPSILYCIMTHPIEKILDNTLFQDQQIDLDWSDKRLCLIGRQKLLIAQAKSAVRLASIQPDVCTSSHCFTTRARCAAILSSWDKAGFLDYMDDNFDSFCSGLCPSCQTLFKEAYNRATLQMWDDLPALFSLPSWQDLGKTQIAASD